VCEDYPQEMLISFMSSPIINFVLV